MTGMKNLTEHLKVRHISQSAFAARIGVTQATVSRWLSGSKVPRASSLHKIADETGLSVDVLMDRKPLRH